MLPFSLVRGTNLANVDTTNANNRKSSSNTKSKFASFGYIVAAGFATLGLASSAQAQTTCTGGATLIGPYGLFATGIQAQNTAVLKALTGTVVFDGKCGLTGKLTVNENGGTPAQFAATTGSYSANPDGAFAINLAIPGTGKTETYVVNYVPSAHELIGNETDGSAYATIDLKAQVSAGSATQPSYGLSSLTGTFAVSGVYNDMLTLTFDGSGYVTATDRTSTSPQGVAGTGTYLMYGTDGSFGGNFAFGGTKVYYGAALNNDTNDFQMVVNSGPANGFVPLESFTAKRLVPPANATFCAFDFGTCTIPANTQATVWYGVGSAWYILPARSGSFTCVNYALGFNDPAPNVQKSCKIVTY